MYIPIKMTYRLFYIRNLGLKTKIKNNKYVVGIWRQLLWIQMKNDNQYIWGKNEAQLV